MLLSSGLLDFDNRNYSAYFNYTLRRLRRFHQRVCHHSGTDGQYTRQMLRYNCIGMTL